MRRQFEAPEGDTKKFLFVLIHVLLIRLSGVCCNRSDPIHYAEEVHA